MTKAPNLPAHANQPTCCHCTRLTSKSVACLLAPSANTSTTMIITPAYHTRSQRQPAVASIHCSRCLPLLLCHLWFSSTLTSIQEFPQISHLLTLLHREQHLTISSKWNNHTTKAPLAMMKSV